MMEVPYRAERERGPKTRRIAREHGLVRGQRVDVMAERDGSRGVSGALAALLELEEDVARRIEKARESSEQSLAQAREAAERARDQRPQELSEAVRELKRRLEIEHREELASIEASARREAQRFDAINDVEASSLADALVEELLTLVVAPQERPR